MKNIFANICMGIMLLSSVACNEKEFLKETPLDFLSPESAYKDYTGFQSALTGIYNEVRAWEVYSGGIRNFLATDIAYNAREDSDRLGELVTVYSPTGKVAKGFWEFSYQIIKDANGIIAHLKESGLSKKERTLIEAEARFFRAYGYRTLVYFYGGVPLVKEEITHPKKDFTRASKEDVLNFIIEDFEFAAQNLPGITEVNDGKVSDLVAKHYLAETYISVGDYESAIINAGDVISNSNTALMTKRFGTRVSAVPNGDVYFDLFQRGNQNRKTAKNKEALWVMQLEVDVNGGYTVSTTYTWPLERYHVPSIHTLTDPDGKPGMLGPRSDFNIGGRGVSYMKTTDWHLYDSWGDDFNTDIRNSAVNIIRDVIYDNPESAWYGKSAIAPESMSKNYKKTKFKWYPWLTKVTCPGDHPEALYVDREKGLLTESAGGTYADQYLLRLAETYLLRAEAYLLNKQPDKAAADINVVRRRAKASDVAPADVTLDYILDERARELCFEERRRLTLHRTGTYVDRMRRLNEWQGSQAEDHMNLFPIPYSFIEANIGAVIEQNPGYSN